MASIPHSCLLFMNHDHVKDHKLRSNAVLCFSCINNVCVVSEKESTLHSFASSNNTAETFALLPHEP